MKRFFLMLSLLFCAVLSWTQVVHDPNDVLYKDLDRWAVQGYVDSLPQLRPYPAQLVDKLLNQVIARGNSQARERAERYLASVAAGSRPVHVGLKGRVTGMDDDVTLDGAPTVDGVLRLEDWLSASFYLGVNAALRRPGKEITVPGIFNPYPDFIEDWADIGPFHIMQNWTSMAAVGTADLYFQSGLSRSSFGPFFDNGTVIGSQAGRTGHFSLAYHKERFSFTVAMLELTATDDFGQGQFPDKHLIIHSLDVRLSPDFSLGFLESVVWGGRMEPLYLAPFNQYFAAQSMTGFDDNAIIGAHFNWTGFDNLAIKGQVYADDLNFNDLARLNFDTKYKLAAQLGFHWVSEESALVELAGDYTLVTPYMYTHITSDRENWRYVEEMPNYLNYTHKGKNLGADLEPNSDRVFLRSAWQLIPNLELSTQAYLIRHGNASEGIDGMTALNDGSIFDDGYTTEDLEDPKATFHYETRFLSQSVIETLLAGGLGLEYRLPVPFGMLTAQLDYVFEYGWNRELLDGNDEAHHFWYLGGSWRW